jgi:hypothetical protein
VVALILVVGLGLASRRYPFLFPAALGKYPGDSLWALMVFLGWGVLFPKKPVRQIFLLTLAVSYSVEFSKLYHPNWLDHFRDTTIGHLLLGSTFWWQNLVAYTVGAVVGVLLDRVLASEPVAVRRSD